MAIRHYFMPAIIDTDPFGRPGGRWPYYGKNMRDQNVVYRAVHYGVIPVCYVRADVTPAQHTALVNHANTNNVPLIVLPLNIDATIGDNLGAVQTALETLRIPSDWVSATHTYRAVLRRVLRWFLFAQRHRRLHQERLFPDAADLNNTVGDLPAAMRLRLAETAADLGLDTSAITAQTTLRQLLRIITDQQNDIVIIDGELM